MSSKDDKGCNEPAEDEGQEGLENDDDDEDEDEDEEFIPGAEDDTEVEDSDSDDDPDDSLCQIRGKLSLDEQQRLYFEGNGFQLKSTSPLCWNFLSYDKQPPRNALDFTIDGTCDVSIDSIKDNGLNMKKPTYRKFQVTYSVQDNTGSSVASFNGRDNLFRSLKNDDDDEDVIDSKNSIIYRLYGQQLLPDPSQSDNILEFNGFFNLGDAKNDSVEIVCHFSSIPSCPGFTAGATASLPMVQSKFAEKSDDDLDDDEAVDYDELVALHEDAASSVDAIRKRYRDNASMLPENPSAKKGKSSSDNEDDDIGF